MKEFGFSDSDFYAIARRAYELSLQGAYEPAATLLEGLRAIDPLDRHSLLSLAAVRMKQGRASESAAMLEAWLAERPRDEQPRALLIEALLELGRVPQAHAERLRLEAGGGVLSQRLELRLRAAEQSADRTLSPRRR
ncbi:MAG: hypothetical protein GC160_00355 [Acidobacteria bacterium]|nr:hypothetical protein [Acidobacteriota bacterium]